MNLFLRELDASLEELAQADSERERRRTLLASLLWFVPPPLSSLGPDGRRHRDEASSALDLETYAVRHIKRRLRGLPALEAEEHFLRHALALVELPCDVDSLADEPSPPATPPTSSSDGFLRRLELYMSCVGDTERTVLALRDRFERNLWRYPMRLRKRMHREHRLLRADVSRKSYQRQQDADIVSYYRRRLEEREE